MNKRTYNALRKVAAVDWDTVLDVGTPIGTALLSYLGARGLGAGHGVSALAGLAGGAAGWGGRQLWKKYGRKQRTPEEIVASINEQAGSPHFETPADLAAAVSPIVEQQADTALRNATLDLIAPDKQYLPIPGGIGPRVKTINNPLRAIVDPLHAIRPKPDYNAIINAYKALGVIADMTNKQQNAYLYNPGDSISGFNGGEPLPGADSK